MAQHFDTEILSADSRQFYRELEIGTAKPSPKQLAEVPHHFINHLSIFDSYNAGHFGRDALVLLKKIYKRQDIALMVGGSGLYIDTVVRGLDDIPPSNPEMRQILNETVKNEGLSTLLEELEHKDPEYYEQVDKRNPVRITRALEVIRTSGKKFSDFRKGSSGSPKFFIPVQIGLNLTREVLYQRIDERMEGMVKSGLFEEVKQFQPHADLYALQTVGYTEVFGYFEGKYDKEEALRLLKRNSRRYAKRQLTWFKKDPTIQWFQPDEYEDLLSYVQNQLDT